MTRIRTLLVDDEPLARAGLRALLGGDPNVEVVGECGDGPEAVEAIEALRPDLLFLDVQMPEMDGFDVLRSVRTATPPVTVFVTAYDRHALRAFEAQAWDYVLKPVDEDRFARTLERAKAQVRRVHAEDLRLRLAALLSSPAPPAEPAPEPPYRHRLVVKSAGRATPIHAEDVDWIEGADYYVRLHVSGRAHLLRESMATLERELDPRRFCRVHRSAIVNMDRVREIRSGAPTEVVLLDGTAIPLSRARREHLEAQLRRAY
jgi:two-component system LytT family response regulator